MPRGGKNHAQGGGGIAQGEGKFFARASRAQDSIFLPPLANFSCTPLVIFPFITRVYACKIVRLILK